MIVYKYEIYHVTPDARKEFIDCFDDYKDCCNTLSNILSIAGTKDQFIIKLGKYEVTKID